MTKAANQLQPKDQISNRRQRVGAYPKRKAVKRRPAKPLALVLPISPRLQRAMALRVAYEAAGEAYNVAVAPIAEKWRAMSAREQNKLGEFPHTPETRKLLEAYEAAERRLRDACAPMHASPVLHSGRMPLRIERVLEVTLAGWFDGESRVSVIEALNNLALAAIAQAKK